MSDNIIKSADNKIFKRILSLRTKKGRDKENVFFIEGEKFVEEAFMYCDVRLVAVSESYSNKNKAQHQYQYPPEIKRVVIQDALFNKLADTEHPQGILAVCAKQNACLSEILSAKKTPCLFLLAENINDPGNLGAIIRSADAADADAVILSKNSAEVTNPKVLRGSAGSIFHVPIVEGANLQTVTCELKRRNISVYAAHLGGATFPYGLDLTNDCAFLIGNEARGLSEETAGLADAFVKLPMRGKAESLNAAVAAGVLLYEVVRQRVTTGSNT